MSKEILESEPSMGSEKPRPSVLMLHAYYKLPGGEDNSFHAEMRVFEELGFEVTLYTVKNEKLRFNPLTAFLAVFNPKTFCHVFGIIIKNRPSVIYLNNLWPGISGSVILAARMLRLPTLQAIRNYRLVAPSAKLMDDGSCFVCRGAVLPFSCISRGCYNGSRLQSMLVALSALIMRISAYSSRGHLYLATSQATKSLMVQHGLPAKKISVRANFDTEGSEPNLISGEGFAVIGRLSTEKGILQVIRAWPEGAPTLTVIGDGPQADELSELCKLRKNVRGLGHVPVAAVKTLLRESALVIVPSVWAEPFGRVAIEAMSVGTPVACMRAGGLGEIVADSGVLLEDISEVSLAAAVSRILDADDASAMRKLAYERYSALYTLEPAVANMAEHLGRLGVEF